MANKRVTLPRPFRPVPLKAWMAALTVVGALTQVATPVHAANVVTASYASSGVGPHVMVLIEENQEYSSVIGSSSAPYINGTLIPKYTSATNWFAVQHTSLNDYLELVSGSNQGYPTKAPPYPGTTVVDEMKNAGFSWKAYIENLPSACYKGGSTGLYDKSHNPFVWFSSILNSSAQCNRVVPYSRSQVSTDLKSATPPNFVWVTPNNCDNMHDACAPTNNKVKQGDNWLKANLPTVLGSPWFTSGGAVIITWDEGSTGKGWNGGSGGHIATLVLTPQAKLSVGSGGDHYGTLRGIEEVFGVGLLGASSNSANGDLSKAFGPGETTGKVTDAHTKAAIAGATVTCSCHSGSVSTNTSGVYSFTKVNPGTYTMTFAAGGHVSSTLTGVLVVPGTTTTKNVQLT